MKKQRLCALFLFLTILTAFLGVPAAAMEDPQPQRCTAAAIVDGDTGSVLYAYHAEEKRYPASITKIMTALLVMEAIEEERLSLDQEIAASAEAVKIPWDASSAGIQAGEVLTVEQLLYCLLLPSANEAANILAEEAAGSVPAFAALMNEKALALGLENTHFVNANGLHDAEHYSTAMDLIVIARAAMEYELFRQIVAASAYTVPATNCSPERKLESSNFLLLHPEGSKADSRYVYDKAVGVKTGYTSLAGRCLLSAAVDGERTYYCVVLGSENVKTGDGTQTRYAFAESKRLLEWAFGNFTQADGVSVSTPADGAPFYDVAVTSPYADAVRWAAEAGVEKGTTLSAFSPGGGYTRRQFLTVLWRFSGSPASAAVCPFADVPETSPDYTALCWAGEQGLVYGELSAPCTRAQAVRDLWELAGKPEPAQAAAFADVAAGAVFADAVSWAVETGITGGTSETTFSPEDACTRAQAVTFLYRWAAAASAESQ